MSSTVCKFLGIKAGRVEWGGCSKKIFSLQLSYNSSVYYEEIQAWVIRQAYISRPDNRQMMTIVIIGLDHSEGASLAAAP